MHLSLIVFLLSSILFSQIIESSKNSPLHVLSSELLNNKEETIQSENEHIFIAKKTDVSDLNKKRIKNY